MPFVSDTAIHAARTYNLSALAAVQRERDVVAQTSLPLSHFSEGLNAFNLLHYRLFELLFDLRTPIVISSYCLIFSLQMESSELRKF